MGDRDSQQQIVTARLRQRRRSTGGFSDQHETLPPVRHSAPPNRHLANNYNQRDQTVQANFATFTWPFDLAAWSDEAGGPALLACGSAAPVPRFPKLINSNQGPLWVQSYFAEARRGRQDRPTWWDSVSNTGIAEECRTGAWCSRCQERKRGRRGRG